MINKAFRTINGKNNILLSAPHSTMHKRGNSIRNSETRTGQLVRDVAIKANTYGIYKSRPELNDANWDKKSKYKDEVIAMVNKYNITALLDIHGMAAYRKQDICIGICAACSFSIEDIVFFYYHLNEIKSIIKLNKE